MRLLRTAQAIVADSIQQINDRAQADLVDVIVQLENPASKSAKLKAAVGESLLRRRMSLSPRDVIDSKSLKSRRAREKRKTKSTRSSQISAYKKKSMTDLKSAMKNASVKESMSRLESEHDSKKSAATKFKPTTYWTSQSMLLRLTKQELESLPQEIPSIRDVHINRTLSVPIVKVSKPLAVEMEDRLSTTWGIERTNAFGAWGVYGAEGQGVTVAVLDTGVDPEHPDLEGKISHWAEFDDMGNIVDTQNPRDSDQHGTHVAGTIAGGNASGRWIGMAPQATIAAGMVLDGAIGGTDAQVLAGMDWAVEQEVDVINMSLGGLILDAETPPTYTEAIVSAILAGIPVVCAIGNEGEQTTGLPGNDIFALSVGAIDNRNRAAGFSGGRTHIIFESDFLSQDVLPLPYIKPDLSAPGVSVLSSIPGDNWSAFSGTSMATPHVAGAIALLLSATTIRENLTADDRVFTIHDFVTASVDDVGESGQDSRFGFGSLDVLRAIDFAVRDGFGIDD